MLQFARDGVGNADLISVFYTDPIAFFRTVLEDWFPRKMPWVHRGIVALVLKRTDFLLSFGEEHWRDETGYWSEEELRLLVAHFVHRPEPDNDQGPRVPLFEVEEEGGRISAVHLSTSNYLEIMMPRGMSKTTLFNGLILYMIAYMLEPFIIFVSETQTHADRQLGNVKRVLESPDHAFCQIYGNKQPVRSDPQVWREDFFQTLDGIAVQSKGRNSQIRGSNIDGQRPGLILGDDIEDKESVATPEQRKKTLSWLYGDVVPALARDGRLFLLGTPLHAEAMLLEVTRDPLFITIRFGAMLEDGSALWSYFMTERQWLEKRERFLRVGMLSLFYMEYQCQIYVDADSRIFDPEKFRSITIMARTSFKAVAMAIDPAISEKKGADSCSLAVAGMTDNGIINLLDLVSRVGMHPREQVDEYFRLHFLHDVTFHGVEAVAYQQALIHLLQEEMFRQSRLYGQRAFFAITPIRHGKTGKVPRIEGALAPRYRAGYITHSRRFPQLEAEGLDWPNGKKDNLDVFAMTVTLLDPMAAFAGPEDSINIRPEDWHEVNEVAQACP